MHTCRGVLLSKRFVLDSPLSLTKLHFWVFSIVFPANSTCSLIIVQVLAIDKHYTELIIRNATAEVRDLLKLLTNCICQFIAIWFAI